MSIYLKLDGIANPDGSIANIEVLSFTITGLAGPGRATGIATGLRGAAATFYKRMDTTTPQILSAAESGREIANASLTFLPAVQTPATSGFYLKWSFQRLLITSLEHTGNEQGDILPTESFSVQFRNMIVQEIVTTPT